MGHDPDRTVVTPSEMPEMPDGQLQADTPVMCRRCGHELRRNHGPRVRLHKDFACWDCQACAMDPDLIE